MDQGMVGEASSAHNSKTELSSRAGRIERFGLEPKIMRPSNRGIVQPVAIALALIMVTGAGLGMLSPVNKSAGNDKAMPAAPQFMTHAQILIEDDTALTAENGVTGGDGTPGNPYVIQGWDINVSVATTVAGAGIALANITSDIVIRDVNVHSGNLDNAGIVLVNVTNCTVEYSLSTDNFIGIGAVMCNQVIIQNNVLENDQYEGIMVMNTDHAIVDHNLVLGNVDLGIALSNSMGSMVVDNAMNNNGVAGLALETCNSTLVSGNIMERNTLAGLVLTDSNWSLISNNRISDSGGFGVMMMACQNNTVAYNMIEGSGLYGASLSLSSDNSIYFNDFVSNLSSPQASDDTGLNDWNLSYPLGGNFWNEKGGVDLFNGPNQDIAGSDGIWDTPYNLTSAYAAADDYPLVTPLAFTDGPTALFVVTPANGPVSTDFSFNASLCWDPSEDRSTLEVRWDFDGDGSWDTGWSTTKDAQHTYALAGEYNVTMEVRDSMNLTDNMTWHVEVDQVAIPEFSTLVLPIISTIGIFIVVGAFGRRR